jgi:DNA-binding CsgD family transcriptional regulator
MIAIADAVGASGVYLLALNPASGEVLRDEMHRIDFRVVEDYRRYWTFHDLRTTSYSDSPVLSPIREVTLPAAKWRSSPILNEYLLPVDMPYNMAAWLHKSQMKAVALALQGTRRRGPFQDQEAQIFRRILPHVSRALDIRDRLEQAQVRADTWASSLDGLTPAVIVLDSSGRHIESSRTARELLRVESGVRLKADGTLWLRPPADAELRRWILSGRPPVPPAADVGRLLHVTRPGALPLTAMLAPVPFRPTSWIGRDPRWVLVIFDPELRTEANPELIARHLRISAGEAALAAALAAGYNLSNAASRLGVSVHTVRTQLKSIFRKTGIRSQVELVRTLVLGPAGRRVAEVSPADPSRSV